jgi:hypothetical protein
MPWSEVLEWVEVFKLEHEAHEKAKKATKAKTPSGRPARRNP